MAISCGSVQQRELAQAVIVPLKNGLVSFKTASELLISVNQNSVLPGSKTFNDIRTEIVNMKEELEKSEQVASTELKQLDGETERLTVEYSNLSGQKRQKVNELEYLKTQLESHTANRNYYSQALETERRNLASAEDTLRSLREKEEEAERIRNIGIGIMFIPIVGTIAGAVMVGVGQVEMNQASDAVENARRDVDNCDSQVTTYYNKVSEYSSLVYQQQLNIEDIGNKIYATEAKLQDVSVKQGAVADFQAKIRHAVHQLGLLCAVGNAAEVQTRYMILLQPMMRIMEEMTTALEKIGGDNLLQTNGIKSLMSEIKTNQDKLKAICDADTSSDVGFY